MSDVNTEGVNTEGEQLLLRVSDVTTERVMSDYQRAGDVSDDVNANTAKKHVRW